MKNILRTLWLGLAGVLAGLLATPQLAAQELELLPNRVPAPSLEGGGEWLNTSGPLDLPDLRGKFVILDFWTYCCINCMHVLPELKKLEKEFPNHLVVIGVHSPKFATERDAKNVGEAAERYEIDHPIVNDPRQVLWNKYGVSVWPSLRVIDPDGQLIARHQGEFKAEMISRFLKQAIPAYRRRKRLDETPLNFMVTRPERSVQALRYPGKVLADAASNRLFIADSGHNRIVVSKFDGEVLDVIGSGALGRTDGTFEQSSFDHPQGMALQDETLFVADTENHLLRKVDLKTRRVTTIAGTGERSLSPVMRNSSRPLSVPLASPWDLLLHEGNLYIAMAGTHQIWSMALKTDSIGPFAGNVVEDIVDGPLLPRTIQKTGFASFAQPSGLASDGQWLYVADSEGSSIRAVPLRPNKEVTTVLGTARLPAQRLFTFGDRDGPVAQALLQHPLGVAYRDGLLFIADTYNNKIKELDLKSATIRTIAGENAGRANSNSIFHEPAGLSIAGDQIFVADTNHHAIRVIDLARDAQVRELDLKNLRAPEVPPQPPVPPTLSVKPRPFDAVTIKPTAGELKVALELLLPADFKLNPGAPLRYYVHAAEKDHLIAPEATAKWLNVDTTLPTFEISLPLQDKAGSGPLTISLSFYYCRTGAEGLCRAGELTWTGRVTLSESATEDCLKLKQEVWR